MERKDTIIMKKLTTSVVVVLLLMVAVFLVDIYTDYPVTKYTSIISAGVILILCGYGLITARQQDITDERERRLKERADENTMC